MTKRRVLLAGATGAVGRHVLEQLKAAGHFVRTLSRDPARRGAVAGLADEVRLGDVCDPRSLAGACDGGIDVVISCVGAPLDMKWRERRSFFAIDRDGNLNLLAEAKRAGVPRFVYLAANVCDFYKETRYIRAHEAVVDALRTSGLQYSVVRPTGIFVAFAEFVAMARRGLVPVPGGGASISNPIDERDVASALVAVLDDGPGERAIGGPEELSRRRTVELAFEAVGKPVRTIAPPLWVFLFLSAFVRLVHPRLGDLLEFFGRVMAKDAVAPKAGMLRLADYYREVVAKGERAL